MENESNKKAGKTSFLFLWFGIGVTLILSLLFGWIFKRFYFLNFKY